MNHSRRNFFQIAAPALACGLLGPAASIVRAQKNETAGPTNSAAGPYSWDAFYPLVGTVFYFAQDDGATVKLRLTRMDDLRFTPARVKAGQTGGECFSLTFRGLLRDALPQGNYTARHWSWGEFSLFITALGPGSQGGYVYEAAINRSNV